MAPYTSSKLCDRMHNGNKTELRETSLTNFFIFVWSLYETYLCTHSFDLCTELSALSLSTMFFDHIFGCSYVGRLPCIWEKWRCVLDFWLRLNYIIPCPLSGLLIESYLWEQQVSIFLRLRPSEHKWERALSVVFLSKVSCRGRYYLGNYPSSRVLPSLESS